MRLWRSELIGFLICMLMGRGKFFRGTVVICVERDEILETLLESCGDSGRWPKNCG